MPNDAMLQVRMDAKTKAKAEKILKRLGMTPSEAVRIFMAQTVEEQGLPFTPHIPNAESKKAIAEARNGKLKKSSIADLKDIWEEN